MLVLKDIVVSEFTVGLSGNEIIEVDTTDTVVALLLKAEVVEGVADGLWSSGGGGLGIGFTEGDHGVDVGLLEVEWVEGAWKIGSWCDDVSESNVGVSELSSEETIHAGVVAGDLEVSPEHVNRLVLTGINGLEGLGHRRGACPVTPSPPCASPTL